MRTDGTELRSITTSGANETAPALAPDGVLVAYMGVTDDNLEIYLGGVTAEGAWARRITFDDASDIGPAWAPDGQRVAVQNYLHDHADIFLLDATGAQQARLTAPASAIGRPANNVAPAWAPDGRHLAFVSDRSGRRQVWVIDTETGRIRQLTTLGSVRLPAWSRRLTGGQGSSHQ